MYQQFYNFSAEPFRLSPDHGFAYSHKGYSKARAYMAYAFMRAEGFVMITGRPGTGKTTLIGALLDELAGTSVNVANLVCTQLQADDLLKMVAYDFDVPVSVVEKGELLQRLTQQLKSWYRDGRRALLIVDEAQDLSVSAMEELRLLTNIQVDSRPLLQIFLLGQPELRELVLSPPLEQVHQRIIAASHLRPLESDETEAYIRHRLETVNWHGNPAISKAVYPLIYKFSEGVPRRINLICSRLLLHCAVEQKYQISVADMREVVLELQEENLASGDSFVESDFLVADVFAEEIPKGNGAANTTIATSPENIEPTPIPEPGLSNGRAQVMDRVPVNRRAVEPGDGEHTAERRRENGGGVPQTLMPVQEKPGVGAEPSVPLQDEDRQKPETVTSRPLWTEATRGRDQEQAAMPAAETPPASGRNTTLRNARGRESRKVSGSGSGSRSGSGSGSTGPVIAASPMDKKEPAVRRGAKTGKKNDRESDQKRDSDPAVQERENSFFWLMVVILPITFLLTTWMMLGLDVGIFVELMPSFLTDFLASGLNGHR